MPTLPLELVRDPDEPDAIMVFVDATIGGEPVRLLVDTGGGSSTVPLTEHTAALDVVDSVDDGRGAGGQAAPDDVVIVPKVALGSLVLRGVRADRLPADSDRPAILGMNVLGNHRCHFRFTDSVVEIDEAPPVDSPPLPFTALNGGQPMVPVRVGPITTTAFWDTGAALTVADASFAAKHPELFELGEQSVALDASNNPAPGQLARMAGCTIGGVEFAASPCLLIDLGPISARLDIPIDLGLGMPLLATADWVFDFPTGTWALTASENR